MIKKLRQLFNDKDKVNKMLDALENGHSIQLIDGLTISYGKSWYAEKLVIGWCIDDAFEENTEKE